MKELRKGTNCLFIYIIKYINHDIICAEDWDTIFTAITYKEYILLEEKLIIKGNKRLQGEVYISGAKTLL